MAAMIAMSNGTQGLKYAEDELLTYVAVADPVERHESYSQLLTA